MTAAPADQEDEDFVYLTLLFLAVTSGGLRSGAGGEESAAPGGGQTVRVPVPAEHLDVRGAAFAAEPSRRFGSSF